MLDSPVTRTYGLIKLSTETPFIHLHLLKKLVLLRLRVRGVKSANLNTGTLLHVQTISGILWEVDNIPKKEKRHTYYVICFS
jgi:hypothetical protein